MNCAELCQRSAKLKLSRSAFSAQLCAVCAQVCAACAASCQEIGAMETCVQPLPAMLATAAHHSHANAACAIKTAGNNTVQPQSDGKIKKVDRGAAMCDACAASCEQACYKEACA